MNLIVQFICIMQSILWNNPQNMTENAFCIQEELYNKPNYLVSVLQRTQNDILSNDSQQLFTLLIQLHREMFIENYIITNASNFMLIHLIYIDVHLRTSKLEC